MHTKVETITPALAEKYLSTNVEHQRHIQVPKVGLYAKMMRDGEWALDGQSLKFAKNGKKEVLIDGQHRLHAIILAGTPIETAVIRGLGLEAFHTLDQVYGRTVEHFYQIAGTKHSKVSSQVAKWMYYNENGETPLRWRGDGPTPLPGFVSAWGLENHPDIPEVLDRISDDMVQFNKKGLGTKNYLAYCYYKWQTVDKVDAYNFAHYLATGQGSVPITIMSLREYLFTESKRDTENVLPGNKRAAKVLNAMMTAWNKVRGGGKNVKAFHRLVASFNKKLKTTTQGSDLTPADMI